MSLGGVPEDPGETRVEGKVVRVTPKVDKGDRSETVTEETGPSDVRYESESRDVPPVLHHWFVVLPVWESPQG